MLRLGQVLTNLQLPITNPLTYYIEHFEITVSMKARMYNEVTAEDLKKTGIFSS